MTLVEKLKLLIKCKLPNVYSTRKIKLNNYSRELLEKKDWLNSGLFKYKIIPDPTGEWRFYIPHLSSNHLFRIRLVKGFKSDLSPELEMLVLLHGRVDPFTYNLVWNEGKTIKTPEEAKLLGRNY